MSNGQIITAIVAGVPAIVAAVFAGLARLHSVKARANSAAVLAHVTKLTNAANPPAATTGLGG